MQKILIVEDDTNINNLLQEALSKEGYSCEQAFSGTEAKLLLNMQKHGYALVLLDLMLPGISGEAVLEEIRKKGNLPVIVLTAKDSLDEKVEVLTSGADDYITKPFGIMELISRVKALLRRTGSSDEEKLIGIGSLFIDDEKRVAYVDDKPVELTYKEYELLKYLALNRGIVLTRDNIMDRIWSTDYEGESRTLDVHIKTLRHKLGTAGNYIKTVRNVGYFMDDEAR